MNLNDFLRNWSTDGMTTEVLSSSQVKCTSNHLTSFAVLVDHSPATEARIIGQVPLNF